MVMRLPFALPCPGFTPTASDVPRLLELASIKFFGSFLLAFFPPKSPVLHQNFAVSESTPLHVASFATHLHMARLYSHGNRANVRQASTSP